MFRYKALRMYVTPPKMATSNERLILLLRLDFKQDKGEWMNDENKDSFW